MGPLVKLASMLMPAAGRIYNDSIDFGKQFPRHNQDGPGDAARHAYASARMAKEYGPTVAKIMGGLHEMTSLGQDRRSEAMDDYNNKIGYSLSNLDDDALKEVIMGMLSEGDLKTLPKGMETQGYAEGGLVKYGNRPDGTPKGSGYYGELRRPDGDISTELGIDVNLDGKDVSMPLLVPTLHPAEINNLLRGGDATDAMVRKAVEHAIMRQQENKSPYADESEHTPLRSLRRRITNWR